MKKITTLILILLMTTFCFGQKGKIKAKIVDADSGKPITTGIVILFGTTSASTTNESGEIVFEKIPTQKTEIIVSDRDNLYMQFILTNIDLRKDKKEIDLGIIPLLKRTDSQDIINKQCLKIEGKTYKTQFVDGNYRFIEGNVAFLDLDNPINCE